VVAGPDGNLWFAENTPSATGLGRITTGGQITEFPISPCDGRAACRPAGRFARSPFRSRPTSPGPSRQGLTLPPLNDQRYPPFYRLDARLEKRWSLGKERSVAFVAEVQNATLSKEARAYNCSGTQIGSTNTTTCSVTDLGLITLPSVGVEAFF
jgi:hypothetical protein